MRLDVETRAIWLVGVVGEREMAMRRLHLSLKIRLTWTVPCHHGHRGVGAWRRRVNEASNGTQRSIRKVGRSVKGVHDSSANL